MVVRTFCGTEKDDPTQLHVIMLFPSMEVLKAFGANEELMEIRKQAGAVIFFFNLLFFVIKRITCFSYLQALI